MSGAGEIDTSVAQTARVWNHRDVTRWHVDPGESQPLDNLVGVARKPGS